MCVCVDSDRPHLQSYTHTQFNKGRDNYDTSPKRRAPAWTDRVLYKPCAGAVECTHYDSVPFCRHSDHRPVLARFRVALRPREEKQEEEEVEKGKDGMEKVEEEAKIEEEEEEDLEEDDDVDDESTKKEGGEDGRESGYESDEEEEESESEY